MGISEKNGVQFEEKREKSLRSSAKNRGGFRFYFPVEGGGKEIVSPHWRG